MDNAHQKNRNQSPDIIQNQESNDEDDYMSDKFLFGVPSEKEVESKKRQREKEKPKKQPSAKETLQALEKPISSENKGFQLLQKMGYKAGQKLGKESTQPSPSTQSSGQEKGNSEPSGGLLEPLAPIFLEGRRGFHQIEEERKATKRIKRLRENEKTLLSSFKTRKQQEFQSTTDFLNWKKALAVCKNLALSEAETNAQDLASEPQHSRFFPFIPIISLEEYLQKDESEREELPEAFMEHLQQPINERLDEVLKFLRQKYLYCIYCGCSYDSSEQLQKQCPGVSEELH